MKIRFEIDTENEQDIDDALIVANALYRAKGTNAEAVFLPKEELPAPKKEEEPAAPPKKAKKAKAPESAPIEKPKVEKPEEVTADEVRAALLAWGKNNGGAAAAAPIIKEVAGVGKIKDVDPKHYEELLKRFG